MTDKLYAERYAPDLEPWFGRHMSAMTGEELHSKSAIACELAVRDLEIERLRQRVKELDGDLAACETKWNDAANCCAIGTQRAKELEAINSGAYKIVDRLEAELAELRKAQGEPATEVVDLQAPFPAGAIYPPLPIGTKLYTSAPSIQHGKLVGVVVVHGGNKVGMLRDQGVEAGTMLYTAARNQS